VVRILKLRSPVPYVLSQVLVSNVAGAATLIGDPPNIIIGSAANIDFNQFISHMGPVVVILFVVSMISLKYFFFRNDLKVLPPTISGQGQAQVQGQQQQGEKAEEENRGETREGAQYYQQVRDDSLKEQLLRDERTMIKDRSLLKKSMIVLIGVIVLFTLQGSLHLEVSMIALGGAAVLLVITRAPLEKVLHEVDWATLVFFTGLFIIVGTAQQAGLIKLLSTAAINVTGGNPWLTFVMMIWLSGIASAFVDNIPFTATMIPVIQSLNANPTIAATFGSNYHISPLWWALALGADLGGNGTLVGSSAGIIAAGLLVKFGHPLTFGRWFRIGFPFMIIALAVGTAILPIFIVLGH
jgi:Na+/H+ antiporter NhaD/arsenite permease-like protein